MLKEEYQGGGAEEGSVLAVKLGFAELRRSVRRWLSRWVASQRWSGEDGLIDGGSWCCRSGGGGCVLGVRQMKPLGLVRICLGEMTKTARADGRL